MIIAFRLLLQSFITPSLERYKVLRELDISAHQAIKADVHRGWVNRAIKILNAEETRAGETPLHKISLPDDWGVSLYLKDESRQPTGSLKHRLARYLFRYALCNGWLVPGMTVVEASSGSTAVSEAYFAQLLGLDFIAVVPGSTSAAKIERIEAFGGKCLFVDNPADISRVSVEHANKINGIFLDQFTYAERASEWGEGNNIAARVFKQLREEEFPVPKYVVVGAGTGGTSATFGRHARRYGYETQVCVADPEGSAYSLAWEEGNMEVVGRGSLIEGIGRPSVESSYISEVVDSVHSISDAASIAAMRYFSRLTGYSLGGSTGTCLWVVYEKIKKMLARGEKGSIVTLISDGAERYLDSYYNDEWLRSKDLNITPYIQELDTVFNVKA